MATYDELKKEIKSKSVNGNYVLYGMEDFFIDKLTEMYATEVIPESEQDFCQKILYGQDIDVSMLRDLCMSMPMSFQADPKQLILIKEAQNLKEKSPALIKYLEQPNPQTILILSYKKVDKIPKQFPKNITYFKSDIIEEKNLAKWIQTQFESKNYKIENKAIQTIIEYNGTNIQHISNEIEKMILMKPFEKIISSKDIEDSFGVSKEYNFNELNNSLGEKNIKQILKIIHYYSEHENKFTFEKILGSLFSFFNRIYIIKLGVHKGLTDTQLAATIGDRNTNRIYYDKKKIANYSIYQIEEAFLTLHYYDIKNKGMGEGNNFYEKNLYEMMLRLIQ